MKIDGRRRRSSESAILLSKCLEEVIAQPEAFSENQLLLDALRSQGALAAYENSELGIVGCSLNTLKRGADDSLSNGFRQLDSLRIQAGERLAFLKTRKQAEAKSTKSALKERLKQLQDEAQILKEDLEYLTLALCKTMTQGKNYASRANNPSVEALCHKEQQELLIMLSARRRFVSTNVIDIT